MWSLADSGQIFVAIMIVLAMRRAVNARRHSIPLADSWSAPLNYKLAWCRQITDVILPSQVKTDECR